MDVRGGNASESARQPSIDRHPSTNELLELWDNGLP